MIWLKSDPESCVNGVAFRLIKSAVKSFSASLVSFARRAELLTHNIARCAELQATKIARRAVFGCVSEIETVRVQQEFFQADGYHAVLVAAEFDVAADYDDLFE